jgi:hypothetical protein
MRAIRQSGSMSGMWKRSHGRTNEAPPDERGGYKYVRPPATAPHLDSTRPGRCRSLRRRSLHYALQTSIIRTYALASRLRASWMEARVTKVARVSVRFSKSLAKTPVASEPGERALDNPAARQRRRSPSCRRSVRRSPCAAAAPLPRHQPRWLPAGPTPRSKIAPGSAPATASPARRS